MGRLQEVQFAAARILIRDAKSWQITLQESKRLLNRAIFDKLALDRGPKCHYGTTNFFKGRVRLSFARRHFRVRQSGMAN